MIILGSKVGSVLKKNSSRWVPPLSRTNTQRIGTRLLPDLYQCPARLRMPTRRMPPPYHATVSRRRRDAAAACRGLDSATLNPRASLAVVRGRTPGLTHQISQGFGPVQLTGSRSSTPL